MPDPVGRPSRVKEIVSALEKNFQDPGRAEGHLAALGLTEPSKVLQNIRLLREGAEQAFSEILPLLMEVLPGVPDPAMALNNFERFAASDDEGKEGLYRFLHVHPEALTRILFLFGTSHSLALFLRNKPRDAAETLARPDLLRHRKDRGRLDSELAALLGPSPTLEETRTGLRHYRQREYARIVLRDLLGQGDVAEITAEISDLADACLQAAVERCDRELRRRYGAPIFIDPEGNARPCRYTVFGMGKLGGGELNYSSDIDLIFLYSSDNGETTGLPEGAESGDSRPELRISNHEYYVKLSELLTRMIGETTSDGVVFRVDTRLRPEGEKGDLACSLRSYEIYYESWGQTWERAALLKARPVTGDEALGLEFLRTVQPFVYRKYLDFRAIEEIREMKRRINQSVALKGRETQDVKLGYGGIREVEFFAQALQLLYGGREPWIRERNTLRALHRLAQKGFITYEEEDTLSRSYRFLRTLEHRIQILHEQQTQLLPSKPEERVTLARRMGYPDGPADQLVAALLRDYQHHTHQVRAVYDDLFRERGEEEPVSPEMEELRLILEEVVGEEEGIRFLARHPFSDPRKAYRNIILLRDGQAFSHQSPRSRQIFIRIFPEFFKAIVDTPDPDLAVNHLEGLISAVGARETFYAFFQNNPQAIPPLVLVLGSSEYLSRLLIRHPDLVDLFLDPAQVLEKKSRVRLAKDLLESLAQAPSPSEKGDLLRKFKYTEELRIGLMDLLKVLPLDTAMRHLSILADLCVQGALAVATEELQRKFGQPMAGWVERSETQQIEETVTGKRSAGFCVIAVGKFGGEEITYGSDLDIFFIYSGEGETTCPTPLSNHEYFAQLASKLTTLLTLTTREGTVFPVDTRLRPSGSKGPLAQSLEAFTRYFEQGAETWERQMLTRARVVAGDPDLGRRFIETCHRLTYPATPPSRIRRDIFEMRQRMENERSKEDPAHYDIKVGPGGIVDIEFLVQSILLSNGGGHPAIRLPHTLDALAALKKEGLLSAKDAAALRKNYLFLRTLESRLRIVSNFPSHLLPRDPARIRPIARRMGYKDTPRIKAEEKLLREYLKVRKRVREMFERIVGG